MPRLGSAKQAARLFGLSLSAFNHQRARATYLVCLPDGRLEPVAPGTLTRAALSSLHLVAPDYSGEKRPGARWEFNLTAISRGRGRDLEIGDSPARAPSPDGSPSGIGTP